jgi:hypothetical protein
VAEILSFSNPIPVFSISSQNPAKLFQSLSAINSLISVFSIQSCRLGGQKSILRQKIFVAEFPRQNFHFLIKYSNVNILSF